MSLKKYKARIIFIYIILFLTASIYVVGKTYSYRLNLQIINASKENKKIKADTEQIEIEINSILSKEVILKEYPELKIHDNLYYLEEIKDE